MTLTVCLLASEAAPLSKTGGLADVSSALTKYLHSAGHDVRLFTPLYSSINRGKFPVQPVEGLQNMDIGIGPHNYVMSVMSTTMPGSTATIYLLDCPALFSRPTLYTTDADEHLRFLAFTRAVFTCCQRMQWAPQILHCNDWHTGFAPLFLKALYDWDRLFAGTRSVLTIHNIGYQGVFASSAIEDLSLGPKNYMLHQDDLRAGRINPLRQGILYADLITTVSPTHAREICTDQYGMGLQDSLRARAGSLVGILNGVDYSEWDPRNDHYLPKHFDQHTLAVKTELKQQLMQRMGLTIAPEIPLAGIVSRLAAQKGLDLMFDSLPAVLEWRDFGLIALGSGDAQYEKFLAELQQ